MDEAVDAVNASFGEVSSAVHKVAATYKKAEENHTRNSRRGLASQAAPCVTTTGSG